jgi:mRNA-degrading endonuclease RelE of RelBE toxin-antitoxin system
VTGGGAPPYELRVAGPAARQLDRLPEKVAVAIVEFMLGPLLDDPYRVGGSLRRELEGLQSVRRGAYRVIYEINERSSMVVVLRIDHRATSYRPTR